MKYPDRTYLQAAPKRHSGFLRRFLLPPISVILVSAFLALFLIQIQVDTASTAPLPTEQALTKALPPDDGIADLFTPEVQYWEDEILEWSKEFDLDPNLVATVMQIESCGYERAKSVVDAKGLFQVMPHHFKKKDDPYDPDTNAIKGLTYLRQSLISGGSTRMALAGYNAGIGRAKTAESDWPDETQRYVFWGHKIYQDAKIGKDHSGRLDNWLSRGGKNLCERAALYQKENDK
jgi:soluble lytic murein transglycosylase-like protein